MSVLAGTAAGQLDAAATDATMAAMHTLQACWTARCSPLAAAASGAVHPAAAVLCCLWHPGLSELAHAWLPPLCVQAEQQACRKK
jgi:hypothetical protein